MIETATTSCRANTGSRRIPTMLGAAVGLALMLWLLLHIGIPSIVHTLAHTSARLLVAVAGVQFLGLVLRYVKVRIYNPEYSASEAAELFLMSRLGGEVSAALYLTPMLKSDFRRTRVAGYVLLDRLLEVGVTVALAAVAAAALWGVHPFLHVALAVFVAQLLVIAGVLFFPLRFGGGLPASPDRAPSAVVTKWHAIRERVGGLRAFLHGHQRNLPVLAGLTLAATLLDMFAVFLAFGALGADVQATYIPVIWALGATVSAATFIGVGPAEVTWVYLFSWLFGVAAAATGGMILLTRATGWAVLGVGVLAALGGRRVPSARLAESPRMTDGLRDANRLTEGA